GLGAGRIGLDGVGPGDRLVRLGRRAASGAVGRWNVPAGTRRISAGQLVRSGTAVGRDPSVASARRRGPFDVGYAAEAQPPLWGSSRAAFSARTSRRRADVEARNTRRATDNRRGHRRGDPFGTG